MKRVDVSIAVASNTSPKNGLASWGMVLRRGDRAKRFNGCSRSDPAITANAASVQVVLRALAQLRTPCRITLRSESLYLQESGPRLDRWERNGWERQDEEGLPRPVANADLWQQVVDALRSGDHVVAEWTPVGRHREHELSQQGNMTHRRPIGSPVPTTDDDVFARNASADAMLKGKERHKELQDNASPAEAPWFPGQKALKR